MTILRHRLVAVPWDATHHERLQEVIRSAGPVAKGLLAARIVTCHAPPSNGTTPRQRLKRGAVVQYDGGVAEELPTRDELLVSIVAEYLGEGDGRFAIFENELARAGDPVLARLRSQVRFYEDRVVHWLPPCSTAPLVQTTLRESRTTREWVGVLGDASPGTVARIESRTVLDDADLDVITQATRVLVVGTGDGESFLMCDVADACVTVNRTADRDA